MGLFRKHSAHFDIRLALVIIAVIVLLWLQAPRFSDPYLVDGDFRSFYWMNKFLDPTLYPDDRLTPEDYSTIHMPWGDLTFSRYSLGYGLLYYIASFVFPPALFSSILPFFLLPVTMLIMYAWGKSLRDHRMGILFALGFMFVNLVSSSSFTVLTGLQRAFTFPLLIAFVYSLHRRNFLSMGIMLIGGALIYAPMFVLMVAIGGVFLLRSGFDSEMRKRDLVYLFIAAILSLSILFPVLLSRPTLSFQRIEVGSSTSTVDRSSENPNGDEPMWRNPEYSYGGEAPLFYVFPVVGRGGIVEDSEEVVNLAILLALAGLIMMVRGRRAFTLPSEIWDVLWASWIMYFAAWIAILTTNSFFLYVPNRYIRAGLFLFLLVFILWNGEKAIRSAVASIYQSKKLLMFLVGASTSLACAVLLITPAGWSKFGNLDIKYLLILSLFVLVFLTILSIRRQSLSRLVETTRNNSNSIKRGPKVMVGLIFLIAWGTYAKVVSNVYYPDIQIDERELLAYLKTLPKDVMLAGTPCALDNIPLFARRQVLFNCDLFSRDPTLTRDSLDAYYTDSPQVLSSFCQKYGVDYFVIDQRAYTQEYFKNEKIYFEPYNQEILSKVMNGEEYILADIPYSEKSFQNETFSVVSCDLFAN
jgi:hypothetical protein